MINIKQEKEQLIKEFQKGNKKVFEELYNLQKDSLFYFIYSYTKNKQDAEEILQDTFVKIYKNLGSLEKIESFDSWSFTIAYRKSMDFFKSRKVKFNNDLQLNDEIEIEDFVNPNISTQMDEKEIVEIVGREIEALDPIYSVVAQLRFFQELSIKEIAGILEIPEGTIKRRLSKVRDVLQPKLRRQGVTPETYYAGGGTVILYEAIRSTIISNAPSEAASKAIYGNVVGSVTTGVVAGSSGLLVKVLTVGALLGGTGVAVYEVTRDDTPKTVLKDVQYEQAQTNASLEVAVNLNSKVEEKDIQVSLQDTHIPITQTDYGFSFVVDKNGDYNVRIKDEQSTIKITNIDKDIPELIDISEQDGITTISLLDEGFGVDYNTSYIIHNGEKISIGSDGKINTDLKGDIVVYVYDKVGNEATYNVRVNESD